MSFQPIKTRVVAAVAHIDPQNREGRAGTSDYHEARTKEHELKEAARRGELDASQQTKALARLKFKDAAERWIADRAPELAVKTARTERDRAKAVNLVLGERIVASLTPEDVLAYRRGRTVAGISNGTCHRELDVIRGVLKKARRWAARFAEEVKPLKAKETIGRALEHAEKLRLLKTASQRPAWQAVYYAACLTLSTTMRGCELKGLRWRDIDLLNRAIEIRKSKTAAGLRTVPLNDDAASALVALHHRAPVLGPVQPAHYIFFACESGTLDVTRPQTSWRPA